MLDGIIDFILTGVLFTGVIIMLLLGISVMAREDAGTADPLLDASGGLLQDINDLRGNPGLQSSVWVLGGLLVVALILKLLRKKGNAQKPAAPPAA